MTALDELRGQIDGLDDQLVAILQRRFALVDAIGREKAQTGQPVRVPAREEAILARLTDGLDARTAAAVRQVYQVLFAVSRDRETREREP